jgi:hypothetical protein
MNKDDQKNTNSARRPGGARPWRAAAVGAALAVTALVAACSGGGSHAPGSGSNRDQNLAVALDSFASCIRSHGVPGFHFTTSTPSPPSGWDVLGIDGYNAEYDPAPGFEAAQRACQHLNPGGMTPPHETHQQFLKAVKSAKCMQSHGYPDWPDPNPTRLGFRVPDSIDTNSTQFQAAAKTCGLPAGV